MGGTGSCGIGVGNVWTQFVGCVSLSRKLASCDPGLSLGGFGV